MGSAQPITATQPCTPEGGTGLPNSNGGNCGNAEKMPKGSAQTERVCRVVGGGSRRVKPFLLRTTL